ncbi:MAG: thiamine-phosphate kinase [Chitinophagales bacterium]|nr:thiamine-phosphate kinase [Hyphomicrobiales bacterium]
MIAEYFEPLAANTPGSLGLKDDAAYLTDYGNRLIVTMDALVAGVHFFADDTPEDIAWKALAVNVSDLVAKGARPLSYTMALALPGKPTRDWISNFALGLEKAQNTFGIGLLGGDTTATPGPLTIAITAFGRVGGRQMIRRHRARPGHGVYVSGTIGDAALGLKLRRGDADALSWALDAEGREQLLQRYLRPVPRIALSDIMLNRAAASMDISDGLIIDLTRLCHASGCGARIEAAAIPMSAPVLAGIASDVSMFARAITGGDDYEILCSVEPDNEASFKYYAAKAGVSVTKIGLITAEIGVEIIAPDGLPLAILAKGYEHFA